MLDEPRGSVLRDACQAALREQIAFARAQGVPWGISESAYAGRDHTLAYQYAPQGVPRLALRRTPPDELVIAPYATALAAQIAPHARLRQLARAARRWRARGDYGFIEALDFTPARQAGRRGASRRCSTFMAHHQGMSIVALANVLLDGVARRWGMADPRIEAVASLLHERAPREVSRCTRRRRRRRRRRASARAPALLRDVLPGAHGAGADAPAVQRPLQRDAARQRRRLEPLGPDRHHALARRCAARRLRQLLLPALGRGSARRCRSRSTRRPTRRRSYQSVLPRRPGLLRCRLARPAGAHHGLGQPGRRHRVPPGRAAQPGRRDARRSS